MSDNPILTVNGYKVIFVKWLTRILSRRRVTESDRATLLALIDDVEKGRPEEWWESQQ